MNIRGCLFCGVKGSFLLEMLDLHLINKYNILMIVCIVGKGEMVICMRTQKMV